jgi:hypothetical protein
MSIHIEFDSAGTYATITFALSQDNERQTSVVGSFNDWDPDRNPLLPKEDGTRSTTVTVDATHDVHFRYLSSGDIWFDDPDADELTEEGSVLRLGKRERGADKKAVGLAEAAEGGPLPYVAEENEAADRGEDQSDTTDPDRKAEEVGQGDVVGGINMR